MYTVPQIYGKKQLCVDLSVWAAQKTTYNTTSVVQFMNNYPYEVVLLVN